MASNIQLNYDKEIKLYLKKPVTNHLAAFLFLRSLPKTLLLGGCATELRELMHQIDVMIAQKRITWEREKESLQTKNDTKKQELAAVKAALQLKQQEVGNRLSCEGE